MARGTTGQIPGKSCAFQFQVEKQKTREFFNVWSPNQPRRGECEFTLGGGVVDEPIGFVPRSSPTFTRARDAMMPAASEDPGAPPPLRRRGRRRLQSSLRERQPCDVDDGQPDGDWNTQFLPNFLPLSPEFFPIFRKSWRDRAVCYCS